MNPKPKRTHIALDADLIEQGLRVTGIKTRRELVDFALRELLRRENQKKLLELKGQVEWEGDLLKHPGLTAIEYPLQLNVCVHHHDGDYP